MPARQFPPGTLVSHRAGSPYGGRLGIVVPVTVVNEYRTVFGRLGAAMELRNYRFVAWLDRECPDTTRRPLPWQSPLPVAPPIVEAKQYRIEALRHANE